MCARPHQATIAEQNGELKVLRKARTKRAAAEAPDSDDADENTPQKKKNRRRRQKAKQKRAAAEASDSEEDDADENTPQKPNRSRRRTQRHANRKRAVCRSHLRARRSRTARLFTRETTGWAASCFYSGKANRIDHRYCVPVPVPRFYYATR